MSDPVHKIFVLAGEPSGDQLGADLVHQLKSRAQIEALGVGGAEMSSAGIQSIFPMSNLSVMGFSDVLLRLPLLLWRLAQTARFVLRTQPSVVVLIDSQVFSELLAKRLRKKGYTKPILLYVAPTVWAIRPERAAKLKPLFDEVLAILPFEPAVMEKLDGPLTHYVGHPVLGKNIKTNADENVIALMPGSRSGELRRHLPILREIVTRLSAGSDSWRFFIPTLHHLAPGLRSEVARWPGAVEVVVDRTKRQELLARTRLAVAASGTVTLELAAAQVPMVVFYALDGRQAKHYRLIGEPAVSLPNIILGSNAVPEIVEAQLKPEQLMREISGLLESDDARQNQKQQFGLMIERMQTGEPGAPRQNPAERVLAYL